MPASPDPDHPRLVFLGGVGEIGRNMAVLELAGRALVLDAGLSFPEVEMLGIDLVLPDFQYVLDLGDQVEGVVLTHDAVRASALATSDSATTRSTSWLGSGAPKAHNA